MWIELEKKYLIIVEGLPYFIIGKVTKRDSDQVALENVILVQHEMDRHCLENLLSDGNYGENRRFATENVAVPVASSTFFEFNHELFS